jgi:hypothetical protein
MNVNRRFGGTSPSYCLFHDAFLIEFLFVSDEGGDMLLRNFFDFHQISRVYIPED